MTIEKDTPEYHKQKQREQHLASQNETGTETVKTKKKRNNRNTDLAKIHLLKKQCGLDDETYRDMLAQQTGQRSAGVLTIAERYKVIAYLEKQQPKKAKYPGRPNNIDSNLQLQKIEAQLSAAKLPWSYAISIAKRQCKKPRLELCSSTELTGVINALRRRNEKKGVPAQ